jgi:hypothetical protein
MGEGMKVPWAGDRPRAKEYRAGVQAFALEEWGKHMAKHLMGEPETVSDDTVHVWIDAIWSALSQKRSMKEVDAVWYSTHMWSVWALNDYIRRLGHNLYAWNLFSTDECRTLVVVL